MLGALHRLWGNVGRWLRRLRPPAGEPTLDTKNWSGRVASRRFWAELRERLPQARRALGPLVCSSLFGELRA